MQPIEATTEVKVTLQAGEWNQMLDMISRYTTIMTVVTGFPCSTPLIQKISQQFRDNAIQIVEPKPPNGGETARETSIA